MKVVEAEMEELEKPMKEAQEFLKTENEVTKKKNKLFQKYMWVTYTGCPRKSGTVDFHYLAS